MNTDTDKNKGSATPEVAQVSWTTWMDLLSQKELDSIAKEVGLIEKNAISEAAYNRFEAVCDFRRSMKLFHHYAAAVNQ